MVERHGLREASRATLLLRSRLPPRAQRPCSPLWALQSPLSALSDPACVGRSEVPRERGEPGTPAEGRAGGGAVVLRANREAAAAPAREARMEDAGPRRATRGLRSALGGCSGAGPGPAAASAGAATWAARTRSTRRRAPRRCAPPCPPPEPRPPRPEPPPRPRPGSPWPGRPPPPAPGSPASSQVRAAGGPASVPREGAPAQTPAASLGPPEGSGPPSRDGPLSTPALSLREQNQNSCRRAPGAGPLPWSRPPPSGPAAPWRCHVWRKPGLSASRALTRHLGADAPGPCPRPPPPSPERVRALGALASKDEQCHPLWFCSAGRPAVPADTRAHPSSACRCPASRPPRPARAPRSAGEARSAVRSARAQRDAQAARSGTRRSNGTARDGARPCTFRLHSSRPVQALVSAGSTSQTSSFPRCTCPARGLGWGGRDPAPPTALHSLRPGSVMPAAPFSGIQDLLSSRFPDPTFSCGQSGEVWPP